MSERLAVVPGGFCGQGWVAKHQRDQGATDEHEMMTLRALLEKASDADFQREMIGFAGMHPVKHACGPAELE